MNGSEVPEPTNSGPCRHCRGDHPDERCWHDKIEENGEDSTED